MKPKAKPSGSGLGSLMSSGGRGASGTKTGSGTTTKSIVRSIFDSVPEKPRGTVASLLEEKEEEKTPSGKVRITQVLDFAGEDVEVTKEVDRDSKEAQKFLKRQEEAEEAKAQAVKRPGGLSSIMGAISGKKKKMGCLDKSKMDWNKYVADEGIKEELETYNKGKDG